MESLVYNFLYLGMHQEDISDFLNLQIEQKTKWSKTLFKAKISWFTNNLDISI